MDETSQVSPTQLEATVRERLDEALGDARIPTGTLVAHALHDVFRSEARQQGWNVAGPAWRALEAAELQGIARGFEDSLFTHAADWKLPAGTVLMSYMQGSVIVGDDTLGLDVDRPGLHDVLDLPHRPGGSNLERLLRRIDEMTQGRPCRALGLPTLVDRLSGRHPDHHLRFPPFAAAADVVLLREMDFSSWGSFFCAYSEDEICDLAESIVGDMVRLWAAPHAYAGQVRSARAAAILLASGLRDVAVHAVTIDISNQLHRGDRLAVEFEAWDHAFRRGLVVQELDTSRRTSFDFDTDALGRAAEVAVVHALGADGRIDVLARAVVEAAPQGAAAVLADLADGFEAFVTLPTSTIPLPLRLHWGHGEIRAETRGSHGIEVSRRSVTIRGRTLPEALVVSLAGRPLHSLFDQPFRSDAPIASIANEGGDIVVSPRTDLWLVDCRTGRMWPEA